MNRKIDRDDHVWTGDHRFSGKITGLKIDASELEVTPEDIGAATAEQGELADSSVQPGDLSNVATSGAYSDLIDAPVLGTASEADSSDFATAAQGALADTAVQPGDLPATPTWTTISGKPAFVAEGATAAAARTALGLGTAATTASTAYATAAQGSTADTALQPGYLESLTGYDAGAVQTLKNNSGTLEWVTD